MKKKLHIDFSRVLAVLLVFIAIIYFNLNLFSPKRVPFFLRIGIIRQPINVLLLGTDMNYSAETGEPMPELPARADSIVIAHFDPANSQINLLAIPRDTYVDIPTRGQTKINAAPVYGGISLLKQTVEKLTHQKIDYYIKTKPKIIPKLVNAVGGITVYVDKDMQYTDSAQGLKIDLKQGWQKLNGDRAHQYIRFRKDIQGDIGRVSRQQTFFKALIKSLMKPTNIVRAPFVINTVLDEVETNIPLAKSIRMANFSRMAKINSATASGEVSYIKEAGSVWLLDYPVLEGQIKTLFK